MSAIVVELKPAVAAPADLRDDRYRRLLGEAAWQRLPIAVRKRFTKRLAEGEHTVYRGEVVSMELSRCGWLLAQAARLVGAPLPFVRGATGPSLVVVTEARAMGGQIWCRTYPGHASWNGKARFPQVIQSAKRFAGPTGLEEYLGFGLVMRLGVSEGDGQLVFRSAGYAIEIGGRTINLPPWLSPGTCTVTHRAETDGRFSFSLLLRHPRLGVLVRQVAFFADP